MRGLLDCGCRAPLTAVGALRRMGDTRDRGALHRRKDRNMATQRPPVIETSALVKQFGRTRALDGLELSVAEGHRIAEQVELAMVHAVPKLGTVIVHVDPCSHDGSAADESGSGHSGAHANAHSH